MAGAGAAGGESLKDRIRSEVMKLKEHTVEVNSSTDPMQWFKSNKEKFPLTTRFWLAHSSFPATSCSAERVFNVDGLILTDFR